MSNRLLPHSHDVEDPYSLKHSWLKENTTNQKNLCILNSTKTVNYSSIEVTDTATYSTSAIANSNDMEESFASSTDNTLSMISTPWSTESWTSLRLITGSVQPRTSSWIDTDATLTSITLQPQTSTSYGIPNSPIRAKSSTTITLIELDSIPTISHMLHPPTPTNSKTESDTLNSWSLETFTSTGIVSDSKRVKPKYPWSPNTVYSGTDIYPSTVDTLESRKVSRETLATMDGLGSAREKIDLMIPMNYVTRQTKQGYNPALEWELIKRKCSQLFKDVI
ncbi:mucin-5AC-like [Galleria mellonella]|uniref:Mucin-5AC-like n=1 Tax=Galleria mellonella TaxID=7137 RepID=A0ABM3MZD9_GALME|nr:mucin-5AC-like [Galleria mellonella]